MTKTTTPAVRFKTAAGSHGTTRTTFAAFVTLPDADDEVRVRFRNRLGADQWRCDVHGSHQFATCPHERAALRAWRARREAADAQEGS